MTTYWQWGLMILVSLLMIVFAPKAKDEFEFFKAKVQNSRLGFWVLTSSLVISWIFAKSIINASDLGLKYGIMGGIAYACYYLSFLVGGIVIFHLRHNGGYQSVHHFLRVNHGYTAVILFTILIAIRLFNEVWSNTMVIGSFFGFQGTIEYYSAIIIFTILTLAYVLKGGMRSSLFTDAIQMILFVVLLMLILFYIIPDISISDLNQGKSSANQGGLNLMFVALIQCFSYPFHDPVMTDRGFIADVKLTKKAFIFAGLIGFLSIVLFSLIGIYAGKLMLDSPAAVSVSHTLHIGGLLTINLIMITSASSTLDSTFSSFSKLTIYDLKLFKATITNGRLVMIFIMLLGTIPIFFDPAILSATTISGTMVIGLMPPFIFWKWKTRKNAFSITVIIGVLFGLVHVLGLWPKSFIFFKGDYAELLSVNIVGSIICFITYLIFYQWKKETKI